MFSRLRSAITRSSFMPTRRILPSAIFTGAGFSFSVLAGASPFLRRSASAALSALNSGCGGLKPSSTLPASSLPASLASTAAGSGATSLKSMSEPTRLKWMRPICASRAKVSAAAVSLSSAAARASALMSAPKCGVG